MCEIVKILNHNTILVLKENEEIIVMSKGIGFGKKQGEQVDVPRNAKQYKMQKSYQAKQKSNNIFDYIDPMYIEISSAFISSCVYFSITSFAFNATEYSSGNIS